MTIALAVLATFWIYQMVDTIYGSMPWWLQVLTPVVAYGLLAVPMGFLLPLAIAAVVVLLRRLVELISPKVQTTVQRTRRSAVPPIY